jgi:hypothetical protein
MGVAIEAAPSNFLRTRVQSSINIPSGDRVEVLRHPGSITDDAHDRIRSRKTQDDSAPSAQRSQNLQGRRLTIRIALGGDAEVALEKQATAVAG